MRAAASRSGSNFDGIQHLRGIAALMVVAFHALVPARGIWHPNWTSYAGASGVDIFFVISGFIIYTSQAGRAPDAADFARRRLVRVMPLYWLVTAALIGLHLTVKLMADLSLAPAHVVESFLLIPHYNPSEPGQISPLLVAGWTLTYELFFYGLFAASLGLGPKRQAVWLATTLIALVGLGAATHPTGAIAATVTNPRLIEFLTGVALGAAARARPGAFPAWGWIGVPLGIAALWATDALGPAWREGWSWGPMAALVVAGALCLDLRGRTPKAPLLKLMGDASYSIYLSHLITLGIVRQAWRLVLPTGDSPLLFAGFCLVAFAASAAGGILLYLTVEKPLLAWLNGRLKRRPEPPAALAGSAPSGARLALAIRGRFP